MCSLLNHLASVLNPTEIEDLKAHVSRAQEIQVTSHLQSLTICNEEQGSAKEKFNCLWRKNTPPDNCWVARA